MTYTPQETQELINVLETILETKAKSDDHIIYADDITNALIEIGWSKVRAFSVIRKLILLQNRRSYSI